MNTIIFTIIFVIAVIIIIEMRKRGIKLKNSK